MQHILVGMVLMSHTGPGVPVPEPAVMVCLWTALILTVVFRRRATRPAAITERAAP